MRGWQANKKCIYAPPAILGLCPKLKYPPFSRGDNYFVKNCEKVEKYLKRKKESGIIQIGILKIQFSMDEILENVQGEDSYVEKL